MSSVLRGEQPIPSAQRVVLRAPPVAPAAEPAPPGMWVTEQQLADLQRRWTDEAYARGVEQGQRDARDSARQQADADAQARLARELKAHDEKHAKEQAEKWRSLAAALAGQMQALREQLEEQVADWTFIAATRLLGQQAGDAAVAAVRHVLACAQLEGPVTVLLHPKELAFIQATTDWPADVSFAASDRLALGGCLVQTAAQTLDARLDTQLALLRDALDSARHEPQPDA